MSTENLVPGYGGIAETTDTVVVQSPLGVGIAETAPPAAPQTVPPQTKLLLLGIG